MQAAFAKNSTASRAEFAGQPRSAVLARAPLREPIACVKLRSHPRSRGGDLVENGTKSDQWDQFFKDAQPYLQTSVLWPSLGNHERNAGEYFDIFHLPGNEHWYSFDAGPCHFVILDSNGR